MAHGTTIEELGAELSISKGLSILIVADGLLTCNHRLQVVDLGLQLMDFGSQIPVQRLQLLNFSLLDPYIGHLLLQLKLFLLQGDGDRGHVRLGANAEIDGLTEPVLKVMVDVLVLGLKMTSEFVKATVARVGGAEDQLSILATGDGARVVSGRMNIVGALVVVSIVLTGFEKGQWVSNKNNKKSRVCSSLADGAWDFKIKWTKTEKAGR